MIGTLHEDMCTLMMISRCILKMRNVFIAAEKIKMHILC